VADLLYGHPRNIRSITVAVLIARRTRSAKGGLNVTLPFGSRPKNPRLRFGLVKTLSLALGALITWRRFAWLLTGGSATRHPL